jgi:predicted kinase
VATAALVVMVGPAGSGKSTFLSSRFLPHQVVSLDTLRLVISDGFNQEATSEAVGIQAAILAARCRRRLTTAVDDTNLRADVRAGLCEHAYVNVMAPVAVVMETPFDLCLAQNATRQGDKYLDTEKIRSMFDQMIKTVPDDGPLTGFAVTVRYSSDTGVRAVYGKVPDDLQPARWLQ